MKYCELCGRPIRGPGLRAIVDGVEMTVCERCGRKHGKIVGYGVERTPRTQVTRRRSSLSFRRAARVPRMSEDLEVVEDYAERIKRAREELGIPREVLARMVGEKESTIRRIEAGQLMPTIELARKLEKVLKIKLLQPVAEEEFYEGEEEFTLTLGDIVEFKG